MHEGPAPPLDTELVAQSEFDPRRAAADLAGLHRDAFAGSYVDARAEVVIVATTPAGVSMVEKLLAA